MVSAAPRQRRGLILVEGQLGNCESARTAAASVCMLSILYPCYASCSEEFTCICIFYSKTDIIRVWTRRKDECPEALRNPEVAVVD